jgi:hypothetical protein
MISTTEKGVNRFELDVRQCCLDQYRGRFWPVVKKQFESTSKMTSCGIFQKSYR